MLKYFVPIKQKDIFKYLNPHFGSLNPISTRLFRPQISRKEEGVGVLIFTTLK